MERKVSLVNRALASHTAHLNFNSHTPIWFSEKYQELSLKQSQEYVLWTAYLTQTYMWGGSSGLSLSPKAQSFKLQSCLLPGGVQFLDYKCQIFLQAEKQPKCKKEGRFPE